MTPSPPDHEHRLRRSTWAMVLFLLGFAVLVVVLGRYFLIPAMDALTDATPGEQQQISAYSVLLLAVVLVIVISGLFVTFRISRFFFPPPPRPRTKTQYVDAWSESARRLELQPDEDEQSDDEDQRMG